MRVPLSERENSPNESFDKVYMELILIPIQVWRSCGDVTPPLVAWLLWHARLPEARLQCVRLLASGFFSHNINHFYGYQSKPLIGENNIQQVGYYFSIGLFRPTIVLGNILPLYGLYLEHFLIIT